MTCSIEPAVDVRWTVIIELHSDLPADQLEAAIRTVSSLVIRHGGTIASASPPGRVVGFTSNRDEALALQRAVVEHRAVATAYVKPPESLP